MRISKLMKDYLRFLVVLSVMAGAAAMVNAALSNQLEEKTLPEQTGIFLKRRMSDFLESLPELVKKHPNTAFFWGASEIESGLDTKIIDSVFADKKLNLEAVNVGMRNIHPLIYRQFTVRTQEALQSQKKIKVSFIKIPLNKLTKRYVRTARLDSMKDQLGAVVKLSDLTLLKEHPKLFTNAVMNHLFLFDASTHVVSTLVQKSIRENLAPTKETSLQTYFSIWSDRKFYETPAWNLTERGTYRWNLPTSQEQLEQRIQEKSSHAVKVASYKYFEDCCEIGTLQFDSEITKVFIEQVKMIEGISEKVILYTIPEAASFESYKKPGYEKRRKDLLTSLSLATGLQVHDMQFKAQLQESDYVDFLHLSEEGQNKLYKVLFDEISF